MENYTPLTAQRAETQVLDGYSMFVGQVFITLKKLNPLDRFVHLNKTAGVAENSTINNNREQVAPADKQPQPASSPQVTVVNSNEALVPLKDVKNTIEKQ
jgi:hypothetical protein